MTIQQAIAACNDPFDKSYIWTPMGERRCWGDKRYLLSWVVADPATLKVVRANTFAPIKDADGLYLYVKENCELLSVPHRRVLTPEDAVWHVSDWHCGSVDQLAEWLISKTAERSKT